MHAALERGAGANHCHRRRDATGVEKIADTCDAVAAVHLPGVICRPPIFGCNRLRPIFQRSTETFPRFLLASDAPEVSEAAGAVDASSTITAEMFTSPGSADDMRGQFARLIYRLAAGRNCPAAASLASQAYVAVPNLFRAGKSQLAFGDRAQT